MPPPLEPLFTTRSTSPVNRSITFVATPFPGSIVTVAASAAPASQHTAALTAPPVNFIMCLCSLFMRAPPGRHKPYLIAYAARIP